MAHLSFVTSSYSFQISPRDFWLFNKLEIMSPDLNPVENFHVPSAHNLKRGVIALLP